MTWHLSLLTDADRTLVLDTLRAEAERKEKVAKESSFLLVTGSDPGKISTKQQRSILSLHADAETLRSLAWDLEHQVDVPALTRAEVVEEERAATYPTLAAVESPIRQELIAIAEEAEANRDADVEYVRARSRKTAKRAVKVVEFKDDAEQRAAAMAAHPSNTTPQED